MEHAFDLGPGVSYSLHAVFVCISLHCSPRDLSLLMARLCLRQAWRQRCSGEALAARFSVRQLLPLQGPAGAEMPLRCRDHRAGGVQGATAQAHPAGPFPRGGAAQAQQDPAAERAQHADALPWRHARPRHAAGHAGAHAAAAAAARPGCRTGRRGCVTFPLHLDQRWDSAPPSPCITTGGFLPILCCPWCAALFPSLRDMFPSPLLQVLRQHFSVVRPRRRQRSGSRQMCCLRLGDQGPPSPQLATQCAGMRGRQVADRTVQGVALGAGGSRSAPPI